MDIDTGWRQTGPSLSVGARYDRQMGVIEHGHCLIAIEHGGDVEGRFTTQAHGQSAVR